MGGWNVKVGKQEYKCDTREDRDKVLAALSAALEGEPSAIMRTGGYALRAKSEDDGSITLETSSKKRGTEVWHLKRETVKNTLEYYTG